MSVDFILNSKNHVLDGKTLTEITVEKLFNMENKNLKELSDAANEITRHFQGKKVDVEHLANIKKNFCSEDCSFCSQSAFFDTGIENYELQPIEEIVEQAKKS